LGSKSTNTPHFSRYWNGILLTRAFLPRDELGFCRGRVRTSVSIRQRWQIGRLSANHPHLSGARLIAEDSVEDERDYNIDTRPQENSPKSITSVCRQDRE